jgi:hypothetical protein
MHHSGLIPRLSGFSILIYQDRFTENRVLKPDNRSHFPILFLLTTQLNVTFRFGIVLAMFAQ